MQINFVVIKTLITFAVTRMKLVVAGEEILLVDRLAHILKVNGKDYYKKFNKYL